MGADVIVAKAELKQMAGAETYPRVVKMAPLSVDGDYQH